MPNAVFRLVFEDETREREEGADVEVLSRVLFSAAKLNHNLRQIGRVLAQKGGAGEEREVR